METIMCKCGWFLGIKMPYSNIFNSHVVYYNNGIPVCQKCSERKPMPNIKITAEVDGKIVPLNTISTESFEAIKALEKPKEIPVARLANYERSDEPRLLFKPAENIQLKAGRIYSLDLKRGLIASDWKLENDEWAVRNTYSIGTRSL